MTPAAPPLSIAQSILVLCLITLDEGMLPLSGQEVSGVRERRRAQMEFIRAQAALLGGQAMVDDSDWAIANSWIQSQLPSGYQPAARAIHASLLANLPRPVVRRVLEVVSAVIQWDGVTTDGELALLDDVARAAKMSDTATLEDLKRAGRRLARP